jgi:MFS family permease
MFVFLKIYKGLPKNVYILFLVQIINRFGDFVVPFLSLFLVTKLGYSSKTAGMLVTFMVLLQVPGSMIGGVAGDRWSRKGTYIIAQTLAALCIMFCALIDEKIWIVVLILMSGFFASAVKPTLTTMNFDLLPPEKRKIGSSLLYLGVNLGVSIGPLLAGFLFNHHLKLFFMGDAITSFIAVCLVLLNVEETKERSLNVHKEKVNGNSFIFDMVKSPHILIFLIFYMIYSFIYAQNSFSLPLMLENMFKENGPVYFGYIMSINAVTVVSMTAVITYITRKKASLLNITVGGIFYAIGFGMIGVSKIFLLYSISTIFWTMGEILVATNSGVYIVNNSNENMRARYTALQTIMNSVGKALGVFCMGGFIDKFGIRSVWPFIMFVAFLGSACMYLLGMHKNFVNSKVGFSNGHNNDLKSKGEI